MFKLPDLPYTKDALEPYIDTKTMEIHHDIHHNTFVTNLNEAIKGTEYKGLSIEQILQKGKDTLPMAIRNNAGGYYNHLMFWQWLSPNGGGEPNGELVQAITRDFGSFEAFKAMFSSVAEKHFGSGWIWLTANEGNLKIVSTPNQDNPVMDQKQVILALDVWEHAYYLKYQSRRPDYIEAYWNVINWARVSELHHQATSAYR